MNSRVQFNAGSILPNTMMISPQVTSEQIDRALERILPRVAKPGLYTGGELNQVVKESFISSYSHLLERRRPQQSVASLNAAVQNESSKSDQFSLGQE